MTLGIQVKRLGCVQALRAIAANMVVIAHLIGLQGRFYGQLDQFSDLAHAIGACGVSCFFIISGFVVTQAAQRENWKQFLASRILRIYPIYWLYLGLTAIFVVFWQKMPIGAYQTIASTLLLPTDAQIMPVAWTLVFEVYFYTVLVVIIAAALDFRWAYLAWAIVVMALGVTAPPGFFGNLQALYFIGGGCLALFGNSRVETILESIRTPRWLQKLGDASYSIYLCHFLVIATLGRILYLAMPGQGMIAATICFAAANGFGLASYRWLERPLLRLARTVRPRASA
jgi:peptidoglycan/LPS O-acetylase OafA/YrhL